MKSYVLAVFLAVASSSSAAWGAESGTMSLAAGFDYSSGKYGFDTSTDILIVPVEGVYRTGSWALSVVIPYIWITGNGQVLPKGVRLRAPTYNVVATHFGLGDIETAATYNLFAGRDGGVRVDLTGRIKFGTAEEKLGTGENDYSGQADFYLQLNRFTPMMSVGYEMLGSPPGNELNNVAYGVLGADYRFTDQAHAGLEYFVAQKSSADGAERSEATAYFNHAMGNEIYVRGYLLKGFSDGSPAGGVGVKFTSYY